MVFQPDPSDPATPEALSPADAAFVDAFLEHGFSTPALAAAAGNPHLTVLDALAWLTQPHIEAALKAIHRAHRKAAELRLAQAQFTAIEALAQLAATPTYPPERRRAATTLTRPPRHRSGPTLRGVRTRRGARNSPSQMGARAGGWVREPLENKTRTSQTDSSRTPKPLPEGGVGVGSRDADQPDSGGSTTNLSDATPNLSPDLSPLLAWLATIPDEDRGDYSDAALDRFADRVEHYLGVPLTHPDIFAAIAEGRLHDLEAIAATIRANAPP
jgi:hypothetical protein